MAEKIMLKKRFGWWALVTVLKLDTNDLKTVAILPLRLKYSNTLSIETVHFNELKHELQNGIV